MIPKYWPSVGGAELHTRELGRWLPSNHEVAYVRHSSTEPLASEIALARARSGKFDDDGVPVFQIGPRGVWRHCLQAIASAYPHHRSIRMLYAIMLPRSIQDELRSLAKQYDVVHAVHNGLIDSAEIGLRVAKDLKIAFVWTPLSHVCSESDKRTGPRFRRLCRTSSAVIAMTDFERQWLVSQGAPEERVHVCPVGPITSADTDPTGFRERHGLGDSPVVLFLGRQIESKGYRQLADAARQVWMAKPEARFLFVGPSTPESQSFFSQRADPRLVNLGSISLAEKCSALEVCDVLCVPSTQESLGVVYLEAWCYKKPVVAADIPALREVVDNGENGIIVPQDAGAIAEALQGLLADGGIRRRLGEAGYQIVRTKYDWENLASKVAKVYEGVVSSRSQAG